MICAAAMGWAWRAWEHGGGGAAGRIKLVGAPVKAAGSAK